MIFRGKVSYLKCARSAKADKRVNATLRVFRRNESTNPDGPVFLEVATAKDTRIFKINAETCKLLVPPNAAATDKLTVHFKDTYIMLSELKPNEREDFAFVLRALTSGRALSNAENVRLRQLSRTAAGSTPTEVEAKEPTSLSLVGHGKAVEFLMKKKQFPKGLTVLEISDRTFRLNSRLFAAENLTQLSLDRINLRIERDAEALANIRQFRGLRSLALTNNNLPHIPLDLSGNQLTELPKEMMRLRSLETLSVARNRIRSIDEDAFKLQRLQRVDLSENELRELPAGFLHGRKLSNVDIAGNSELTDESGRKFPVAQDAPDGELYAEIPVLSTTALATLVNHSPRALQLLPLPIRRRWTSLVHPCAFCHRYTAVEQRYLGVLDLRNHTYEYVTQNFGRCMIKMAAKNGEAAAAKGSRFPTKLLHSFECNQAAVRAVRFNVDGNYCITCGGDKTVALWNPVRQIHLKSYRGCGSEILDACGSCDNAMILAGGRDCQPTIFDVESGKMLKRWREHGGVINAVAFNEDSRVALSASQDATIRCFDVRTRSGAFQVIDEATDNVLCMDVSGHEIVSGSADGHVRLYDIREGRLFVDFVGESVTSVHLTDDGQCCLVSSMDGFVRLFDKMNGALLNDFNDHTNQEYRIESTMLKSGDQLASGSEDGHLYVYDVISGKVLSKLDHNPTKFVHSLAAHPTRNDLLLSTAGRKVFVWTAEEED
ncbi:hypothetical protein M3Y99_00256900 [Aphelenchoides fujianensis]|nr:hypothetical protein M3Y99_00256900 [Aphelenchoides fujianensis]